MITFVPFDRRWDRTQFRCGKDVLDAWLRETAGQAEKRDQARTFLGIDQREQRVATYFSLVTYRLGTDELPQTFASSRRYPLAAALLARLAVDQAYQGRGLGRITLVHALQHLARASESVAFEVIVVDAIDEDAATFYLNAGFERFADSSLRLFMTVRSLRTTLASVG